MFGADDLIGEGRVDLTQLFFDVGETKKTIFMKSKYIDELKKENKKNKDLNLAVNGLDKFKFDSDDKDTFWVPLKNKDSRGKEVVNG